MCCLLLLTAAPALAQESVPIEVNSEEADGPILDEPPPSGGTAPIAEEEPIDEEPIDESEENDAGDGETEVNPDAPLQEDTNPLNPAGNSIDSLIQTEFNEDIWTTMLGDLPCLDASEVCVRQLQEMAITNSPVLAAIDERVQLVQEKIDTARENNLRTISLGIFEPAIQAFFETKEIPATAAVRDAEGNIITPEVPARRIGFIDRIAMFFGAGGVLQGLNDIFALIGLPLFTNAIGGNAQTQAREIAIADLEIKIAEIENKRGDLAREIREQVIMQLLDFDEFRREFQISQEVARRDTLRLQILAQGYRFAAQGSLNTPQYLNEISRLDQQKAQTYRAWAKMRTQLTRIKILVLGEGEEQL